MNRSGSLHYHRWCLKYRRSFEDGSRKIRNTFLSQNTGKSFSWSSVLGYLLVALFSSLITLYVVTGFKWRSCEDVAPTLPDPFAGKPLLTLFTTFPCETNSTDISVLQRILSNWHPFPSVISPVAFVESTDSKLAKMALAHNWTVLPIGNDNSNPLSCNRRSLSIKKMYKVVFKEYSSMLYGYADWSTVFDNDLIPTVQGIHKSIDALNYNVLITGHTPSRFPSTSTISSLGGPPGNSSWYDYYFFSKKGCNLNWKNVPDTLTVDDIECSDALIDLALNDGVNVINASPTLSAARISPEPIACRNDAYRARQSEKRKPKLRTVMSVDGLVSVVPISFMTLSND